MAIGSTSSYSFWKQNQIWRAKRQDVNDQLDTMSALSTKMATANSSLLSNKANLTAVIAANRVKQEAMAKMAKTQADSDAKAARDAEYERLSDRLDSKNYYKSYATANLDVIA